MGIRDFISVVRELSFEQLRAEALLAPRVLVVARDQDTARACRDLIFGANTEEYVQLHASGEAPPDPLGFDVVVSVGPLDLATSRTWRDLFRRVDEPVRVVEVDPRLLQGHGSVDDVRKRIADVADERSLALGRYIDAMREACAIQTVGSTAAVNAQFALLSNLPTVLPVVGNLVAVGADFLVLTKNQLMMIYKLAAIYQRDLDDRWRIYQEMIPVVGSGLVWRTVAREIAGLMPLAMGTVPKVAIAYAGTYAIGRAAHYYYEHGTRLDRSDMRALYEEALTLLRRNPLPFSRDGSPPTSPREALDQAGDRPTPGQGQSEPQ